MKRISIVALAAIVAAAVAASAFNGPAPAATVSGEPITLKELRERVKPLTQTTSFKEQLADGGDLAAERRLVEQRVLTQMIREEILSQAARELDVATTEQELDAYVEQLKRDREIRSDRELRKRVEGAGFTMGEWLRLVRFNVLERKIRDRLVQRAKPSEEAARAYYESHLSRYSRARVQHIVVRDAALARRIADRLRSVAPRRVDSLFAELARRYSLDPSTNSKGGDLGLVARGSFRIVLPSLDRAINALEPGDISDPVETKLGLHVVRVVARTPSPFAAVREEIETELLRPRDPYRAYLEDAYEEVEVAERFGELDSNFRLIDPPKRSSEQ